VSNYRPVSLLTSFSKIFELVMKTRILKHLTKYNMLSTEQYGFRIGLKTHNAILNAMNNRLLVGGIICDLEKAFDILLSKLKFYGISGKDIALYYSYPDKDTLGQKYIMTVITVIKFQAGLN